MKRLYGFDEIGEKLRNAFFQGKLHHCNMLISDEGVGKTTFLKQLAALILGGQNESDWERSHTLVENNSHVDFTILNAESFLSEEDFEKKKRDEISVAQVRNLIGFLQKTPLLSKNKAVIIDSIDKVNAEGQNALLKTLEEPTSNTFIFLVCNRRENVLDTVFSRSSAHFLGKLAFEDWARAFWDNVSAENSEKLGEDDMEKLCAISGQSVGLALDIINNNGFDLYENILDAFAEKNAPKLQKFCDEIDKNNNLFRLFGIILEIFFHDLLNYSMGREKNKIMVKNKEIFEILTKRNSAQKILNDYEKIYSIMKNIDVYNMSKKHCLNVIFSNL
ncbi:MAG: AAA family ATPase [Rickettsiales bacterium]|jgi:DNA polymerase-3 subunit delta'|nr:AAA family ATPase [Rickettsiales bacterium]